MSDVPKPSEALRLGASALRYRAERLDDLTDGDKAADEAIAQFRAAAELLDAMAGGYANER